MSNGSRSNSQGLTLLEVLLSIAILGAVVGVLASLQVGSLQIANTSRIESDAQQVAVTVFEEYKTVVQEITVFAARVNCPALGSGNTCTETRTIDGYGVSLSVAGYAASGPGLLTVRVTVSNARMNVPFVFNQFVSCLDTVPSPTLADPQQCPATIS